MKKTAALLFIAAITATAFGQDKPKPLSPPAKAEATIAGKTITIDYSAPSKRNRVIMGGLVPYGKVWRTGANAATALHTDADLMIGTLLVPKGDYTIYTIPDEKEWTLIVNQQTGQWGTKYDETQDLGRVTMKIKPVKDTVETLVIGLKPTKANTGVLTLTWENVEASVPLTVQ